MIDRMERWKRLIYYLLINVAVSACTILTVLFLWEGHDPPPALPGRPPNPPPPSPPKTGSSAENPPENSPDTTSTAPTNTPTTTLAPTTAPGAAGLETYEVQSGDTLGAIADAFGVTVDEIIAVNDLENPDVLDVGDILNIPVPATAEDPVATNPPNRPPPSPPTPGILYYQHPSPRRI